MKKNIWIPLLGLLVAALLLVAMVLYTVREGEAAVFTTFGRPVRTVSEPGLAWRWPWPVQRVYRFDLRRHCLEGLAEQTLTADGKNVIVSMYLGWRVADPLRFLERVGTVPDAERNLNGLLSTYKNAVLGRYPFRALINTDPAALQFDALEAEVLSLVAPEARARYGIDVDFTGLRRLTLPEAITEKVFERMRAERTELAERYRSEGEGEAIRLRAAADSSRDQLLANAEADAQRLRAQGDAEATEFFSVFEQEPELAMFLRKLAILEETLRERATVVLGPDTQPFDLLQGEGALPLERSQP